METLKTMQRSGLDTFKEVIYICKKLEIPYYLIAGGCLGAVRHGGFIPWDDDIDIVIMSYDYDRFMKGARKLLDERYHIEGAFEQDLFPNATDGVTKVYDHSLEIETDIYDNRELFIHPWMDILLLCGLPDGVIRRKLYLTRIILEKTFMKLANPQSIGFNIAKKRGLVEKFILWVVKHINMSALFSEKKSSERIKRLCLKYNPEETEYVAVCCSDYRWKEIMPGKIWGKGCTYKFEDIEVRVPEKTEEYLKLIYGDWRSLPPEEERKGKHNAKIVKCNI